MDIQVPTLCRVLLIHTHPNTKKKTEIRQDFTLFPHTSESFGANITLDDAGRNGDKNAT